LSPEAVGLLVTSETGANAVRFILTFDDGASITGHYLAQ
jgi:hypothetical protein